MRARMKSCCAFRRARPCPIRTGCASSTPEFYLKSRDEMMALFGEVEHALDRTWDIAQRCHVKLEKVKDPFPSFDVPPSTPPTATFAVCGARRVSRSGAPGWKRCAAEGRLKHDLAEYIERLDREIRMIQQMKFSGYFLIVWDFIRFAKQRGHSGGPGPRLGGRQPGRLRDGDHRYRSARIRTAVRALPESRSASACPISTSTSARTAAAR